jgi:tetratricopeptide (TPR) repeat protein/arylsulfatase A-like enzyme
LTPSRLARRVLLIGWDAADWKAIRPLLDAGEMPVLAGMVEQGVMGNIATLRPMLSPMLWTSIATGKRPFQHGIHGFIEPDPIHGGARPVTNLARKTKAVWNILNQNGLTSNVIGWWPSHPAEPLRGVMVSNHYQRATGPLEKGWPMAPGTVHPPSKARDLAGLRIHPEEIPEDALDLFVPRGREVDQSKDERLYTCARILADCTTIHSCATAVMQLEPWDFMAVYYDAIDHFGHAFMKYHPPRREHISEADFEMYKDVVASGYRYHDMMLGTLLKLAGADTTVILMSDHGFHPDHLRPSRIPDEPAGPAVEHSRYGIFVMKGPGIRRDERIYGANLLDVTPTILTLFGLPAGADMAGKPLLDAFADRPRPAVIPSWDDVPGEDGRHPANLVIDPVESREALAQLVALGYVEDPGEDKTRAAANAIRELNYNLALSYADADRWGEAVTLLEALWAEYPDEIRFATYLAHGYRRLGRLDDARRLFGEIIAARQRLRAESIARLRELEATIGPVADGPELAERLSEKQQREVRRWRIRAAPSPIADVPLLVSLLLAEGKPSEAIRHLRQIEQNAPRLPQLHRQMGQVYLSMRDYSGAEEAFRRGIEIDPDDADCCFGLGMALRGQKRVQEAADAVLAAVGLLFFFPQAHDQLGILLLRLGHSDRALDAFRIAVTQAPGFLRAHLRLARLYRERGEMGQSALHRSYAEQIGRKRQAEEVQPGMEYADMPGATTGIEPVRDAASVITIVSGLPRSGTSVMMQMLGAAGLPILTDHHRAADLDNPHGYHEDDRVKQLARDASWIPEARGKALKVIAQLLPHLPADLTYRVIFMERSLDEVLASQQAMIERLSRSGSSLPPERLRRTFAGQVRQMKIHLHSRGIPVLYVGYHEVMDTPGAIARRVSEFLGGGHDLVAMSAVVDASLGRHRAVPGSRTSH